MRFYAMLLCALLCAACDSTSDNQADAAPADASGPDAHCTNAFDDRCAATNGCGAAGAFCCYHFGDDGAVTSVCLAKGTMCESDICVEAMP